MKLEMRYAPVEHLRPNPWNPNVQDDATLAKERRSIQDHGFVDPITVREHAEGGYEIIDGEHRWKAAKQLGLLDVPIACLGKVPDARAKKLTVLLNELRGHPEPAKLAVLLRDLVGDQTPESLGEELPFSPVEISSLVKSLDDFDWSEGDVLDRAADKAQKKQGDADERRFQLGSVKGDVPRWLADALLEEYQRTSERVRSRGAEAVLKDWLARLTGATVEAPSP